MRLPGLVLAVLAGVGLGAAALAEPYAVGDTLVPFALEDQHGELRQVDGAVGVILFSRDMEGGDVLREGLDDVPPEWLAERRAAYVADISGMPRLVARLFALPAMRRRPYPMLLDRDGEITARLPDEAGKATLIFLEDLKITRILHPSTPTDLRQALD